MAGELSTAKWRKAARSSSTGEDCVEVAGFTDGVAVRDSKDPAGGMLRFGPAEWRRFTDLVKAGR